jgi:hypothetical protein
VGKKKKDEFAPCSLVEHDDGTFSLVFDDFDPAADTFEEMGFDAGGYAWHGVVEALVRLRAPRLRKEVNYDPEASMFVAYGKSKEALKAVAALMREAIADRDLLREAIENADPDLMD